MRSRSISLALVTLLVGAGLSALPTSASAQSYQTVTETAIVDTRGGQIYVTIHRPTLNGKDVKAPVIFTYTPYGALDPDRTSGASTWVSRGYARVIADVVGTGNSGGCYDYGGMREKESAYDLVEWLAKQKWSTGKVGMTGGSYDGTTAIAAAVMKPPHLTTIAPIAAISRWYDYAFSGGIRYFLNNETIGGRQNGLVIDEQGFDTPAGFDFGFALPPPLDPQGEGWQDRVVSDMTPCDEVTHMEHAYDVETPDYNDFWLERDYIKDAHKINIPVLIGHNWGDWNVKQVNSTNLYKALSNTPKKTLMMGTRWAGHGAPPEFSKTLEQWMDHYLRGEDNGAENLPPLYTQSSNYDGPLKLKSGAFPKTRNVTLYAQTAPRTESADYEWMLMPHPPVLGQGPATQALFPASGINTEMHANHHARNNHDWMWFESPVFTQDTRIFGEIKVQIYSKTHREWVTYTPTIVDVKPECHMMVQGQHVSDPACTPENTISVTRGWLDSRYQNSLSKQSLLEPGKPFSMTVVTKPQDYTFKKGHYLGLQIATEINEWSIPKIYPCSSAAVPGQDGDCVFINVLWEEGKTRVILPVVKGPRDGGELFGMAGHHHGG